MLSDIVIHPDMGTTSRCTWLCDEVFSPGALGET